MTAVTKKPYEGAFTGNAHYFALRVYTEDTDFGGVVYHANYLHFLERARSDMLRSLGINQRAAVEAGKGVYAVTEINVKYFRPAKLEDDLVIVSQLEEVRGALCIVGQKILRGEATLAEATVKVAFVTSAGRPTRQPKEWVELFQRIKGKTG